MTKANLVYIPRTMRQEVIEYHENLFKIFREKISTLLIWEAGVSGLEFVIVSTWLQQVILILNLNVTSS